MLYRQRFPSWKYAFSGVSTNCDWNWQACDATLVFKITNVTILRNPQLCISNVLTTSGSPSWKWMLLRYLKNKRVALYILYILLHLAPFLIAFYNHAVVSTGGFIALLYLMCLLVIKVKWSHVWLFTHVIDLLNKSHNAPVLYPTMHHFLT